MAHGDTSTIRLLLVERGGEHTHLHGFTQYTWLKYVTGFDQDHHCARSLRGFHSKRVWHQMPLNVPVVLDEAPVFDYIYLCGVSDNYIWRNNLHVVVRHKPGGFVATQTYNGISVRFRNAERVEIPALPPGWNGLSDEFTTCRNFQFGVMAYGYEKRMITPRLF